MLVRLLLEDLVKSVLKVISGRKNKNKNLWCKSSVLLRWQVCVKVMTT